MLCILTPLSTIDLQRMYRRKEWNWSCDLFTRQVLVLIWQIVLQWNYGPLASIYFYIQLPSWDTWRMHRSNVGTMLWHGLDLIGLLIPLINKLIILAASKKGARLCIKMRHTPINEINCLTTIRETGTHGMCETGTPGLRRSFALS